MSELIENEEQLSAALEQSVRDGVPRSLSGIVEYSAEPVQPGLFRKLSVFRVADRLLGYTCVHDDQWIVKYGKPGIASPELYDEEYEFVSTNPFAEALRPVFEIAGVDYGRVDFGLVGGRPQIYEINTNPDIKLRPPPGKCNGARKASSCSGRTISKRCAPSTAPNSSSSKAPDSPAIVTPEGILSRGKPGGCHLFGDAFTAVRARR